MLAPILSSYFHLTSSAPYAKIDFIHESFKEYLLAEYYIKSLLLDKPYRLHVGIPSEETVLFLDGLLRFIDESRSPLNLPVKVFLESFLPGGNASQQDLDLPQCVLMNLIKNAQNVVEDEQLLFHQTGEDQTKELWNVVSIPSTKYDELWINRWISLMAEMRSKEKEIVIASDLCRKI